MNLEPLKEFVEDFKIPVKDLTKNALDKPSKEIGEGLGNLFWIVFSPIHAARAAIEPRIQGFKDDIEREVSKIPPENIVESPLNVIGPALEASKYHIEHEEVREMFAKLIAASMNSSEQEKVHPSFVEVIKQLSPFDVKVLKMLLDNYQIWPIGLINLKMGETAGKTTWVNNFFPFSEINLSNHTQYSTAVQNLTRLSLINVDFQSHYTSQQRYDQLKNHPLFQNCKHMCETNQDNPQFKGRTVEFNEGIWDITDFGQAFTNCCF